MINERSGQRPSVAISNKRGDKLGYWLKKKITVLGYTNNLKGGNGPGLAWGGSILLYRNILS